MSARVKRILTACLLLAIMAFMGGCRARVITDASDGSGDQAGVGVGAGTREETPAEEPVPDFEEPDELAEAGDLTRENRRASRREYDENADVEITVGTDQALSGEGGGDGTSQVWKDADGEASLLDADAEQIAAQTVSDERADRQGVSEEASAADTALEYYTVLLEDRGETLFECKRLNVYWETPAAYVTVFKTSEEHRLIAQSGCYDVSSRLTEERLTVDDGWISRKNPDVIVKVVSSDVLGSGIYADARARGELDALSRREGWAGLSAVRKGRVLLLSEEALQIPCLRVAAALIVAKTAYPELYADVDVDEALQALVEEATGIVPEGVYYFQPWTNKE